MSCSSDSSREHISTSTYICHIGLLYSTQPLWMLICTSSKYEEDFFHGLTCLFFWFAWVFHSRIFHSYGDVTLSGKWCKKKKTYVRHSWPMSSEGSSACHTYCDTGHSFIMPNTVELLQAVLRLSLLGFEHQTFCMRRERSNRLRHRCGCHLL